ncbi:ankyrin repeat domain-containing protein [Hanstruepera marina]|uniref:ankyrin repeat domain-containing protein n=1 Tax=Hanstruepera marina TaxID=2873265 RepID=UPI001CA72082|nr:ankyrin repeat domain-containing protein [Hanstruepera marina]
MKKTIILSAIALSCSFTAINAENVNELTDSAIETAVKEKSPFHMSIVKGDVETVQKLIELGADVNEKWNGLTPAMYAAKYNRTDVLVVLIDNGANLKTKCDKGHTALEYAELSNAQAAKNVIKKELKKK